MKFRKSAFSELGDFENKRSAMVALYCCVSTMSCTWTIRPIGRDKPPLLEIVCNKGGLLRDIFLTRGVVTRNRSDGLQTADQAYLFRSYAAGIEILGTLPSVVANSTDGSLG